MNDNDYERGRQQLERSRMKTYMRWGSTILGIILLFVVLGMWGCPAYKVYEQRKAGEAKLREAESSRQIAIQEAKAKLESAQMLASADTIRAHGIARSQAIIANSLTPQYIQWFFIDNLEKNQNAVFYIPTEAGIPIMEAGRNVRIPPVKTE